MKTPSLPHVSMFIKLFTLADTLLFAGWGFVDPVFSVFIVQKIPGASLVTVGITAAIYLITKSLLQVPIAVFLDKTDGERDDFYALVASLFVAGLGAFGMMFASHVWHVYLLQLVKAFGFALYVASGPAIFARHLDKRHNALDWSLNSTSVGLAMGVTGLLAGILVTWGGYNLVFLSAGILSFVGGIVLLLLPRGLFPIGKHPQTIGVLRPESARVNE